MFILFVIYFICIFLIWWSYAGYIFYLFVYYLLRRGGEVGEKKENKYLSITVIVPVFEEEKLIEGKIKNLKKLVYPGKVEFLLVDGGSKDGTVEKIQKQIKKLSNFKLIRCSKGKISQINKALKLVKGEIIVCTDVDANLPQNALQNLTRHFNNKKVAVVGAYITPKGDKLEKEYWQEQNQLRLVESKIYSASIVVAPCYAFRKTLLKRFPEDCVADDVFISFYAQSKNYLVKYDPKVVVYELRASKNLVEFFTHKFRKANAYIAELLRFVYVINRFNIRARIIFLSRFLQIIILPWILLLFMAISANLFVISTPYRLTVIFVFLFLLSNLFFAAILFNQKVFSIKVRGGKPKVFNIKIFLYTSFILFFAIFTYFFYHQDSSYEKIK